MKITKRNGNITLYDDQKIVTSIMRANAETAERDLTERIAAHIAGEVFTTLTADHEIITTQEVRDCVSAVLREKGFTETAKHYIEYKK